MNSKSTDGQDDLVVMFTEIFIPNLPIFEHLNPSPAEPGYAPPLQTV